MQILPFEAKHLASIGDALLEHGHPAPPADTYPAIGFVALHGELFVAATFVRQVEGGYGQLDGIVTNPRALGALRHEAQDLLFQACIEAAKAKGIKGLMGYTVAKSTGERSIRHGFEKLPHTLYVLNLKA
jgi:hypothetical protein